MMLFDDAFDILEVGTEVTVTCGETEPRRGTPEWANWRHHHHTGWLVEKVEGPPRVLRIELPEEEIAPGVTSTPIYDVVEGGNHLFDEARPADLSKMSAPRRARREKARERARHARMKPYQIVAAVETRMLRAFEALFPDLKITAAQKKALFPNADQ